MKTIDSDVKARKTVVRVSESVISDVVIKKRLKDDSSNNLLTNVFGIPSREEQLDSLLAKICSSLRNAFRVDVRLPPSLFSHTC